MTLEQLVAFLLSAAWAWLGTKVRGLARLELVVTESRKDQGQRLGLLEDRVSRLEGRLGITTPPEGSTPT